MIGFRVGSHVGRTVYVNDTSGVRGGSDVLVGVFDTRELAVFAVNCMNDAIFQGRVSVSEVASAVQHLAVD